MLAICAVLDSKISQNFKCKHGWYYLLIILKFQHYKEMPNSFKDDRDWLVWGFQAGCFWTVLHEFRMRVKVCWGNGTGGWFLHMLLLSAGFLKRFLIGWWEIFICKMFFFWFLLFAEGIQCKIRHCLDMFFLFPRLGSLAKAFSCYVQGNHIQLVSFP